MAMIVDDVLGCGRTVEQVWEHVDRAPDAHEATCPDCRSARASLGGLAMAARDLRTGDDHDESLHAPPDLVGRVLDVARAEVRRGRTLPLREPDPAEEPSLTVSEQSVAVVIRRVADAEPTVEARRCRVLPLTGSTRPGDPARLAVELRISVGLRTRIPEVTARLRTAAIAEVERAMGVELARVDLIVEDVHDV